MATARNLLRWAWVGVWAVLGIGATSAAVTSAWHGSWGAALVSGYLAVAALGWILAQARRRPTAPAVAATREPT